MHGKVKGSRHREKSELSSTSHGSTHCRLCGCVATGLYLLATEIAKIRETLNSVYLPRAYTKSSTFSLTLDKTSNARYYDNKIRFCNGTIWEFGGHRTLQTEAGSRSIYCELVRQWRSLGNLAEVVWPNACSYDAAWEEMRSMKLQNLERSTHWWTSRMVK